MKKLLAAIFFSTPLLGCGGSPTDALSTREKFICTQCHKLPNPSQHTAAQWPGVIARMMTYMQTGSGRTLPEEKERENIIHFYQGNVEQK
ncbi:MAG: hypothetical protein HY306_05615 [Nitrosomonadales bacterium]|nr:hypothetical protein [Nitrosomonadales bacterium]